jgi:mRNA-degrading endonuclease RelE of RelBE toxin-antitoxin system
LTTSSRFGIQLTREAEKDLKKLRPHVERASGILRGLADDPFRGHSLTGDLKGARSLEFSLPGSGVYRAVYVVIDDAEICLIFIVGPHENIYDRAKRRLQALRRSGRI